MSRDEEADEPVTTDCDAVPDEASEPSGHFTVVISGDGSAAIDGEPVPVPEGGTVDTAILDLLDGYARDRGAPVTAAISDPAAGYVAVVEVSPDGSSTLLRQEERDEEPPHGPLSGRTEPSPGPVPVEGGYDDDEDDNDYGGHDDDPGDPVPAPAPAQAPPPVIARAPVSRQSDDEYRPPKLLGRPLIVAPAALAVAALVVVPLVILGSSGGSSNQADAQQQAAGSDVKPASTPPPPPGGWTTPTSAPGPLAPPSGQRTTSPKAGPRSRTTVRTKGESSVNAGGSGGARATVTVTAPAPKSTKAAPSKKAKVSPAAPKKVTAATAVNRLAKKDPYGRHICYRAYVAGQGWQKPVCDGAVAGTTGKGRAIKALNIAVYGAGGSAANAFVHSPGSTNGQGVWKPKWTPVVADGRDNYVGSTKSGAPNMITLAVNIGQGQLCLTPHVRKEGWKGKACAGARPELASGGAWNNDLWLEAVRLTV